MVRKNYWATAGGIKQHLYHSAGKCTLPAYFPTKGTHACKLQQLRLAGGEVVGQLDIEQDAPTFKLSELACSVSELASQLKQLKCSILSWCQRRGAQIS